MEAYAYNHTLEEWRQVGITLWPASLVKTQDPGSGRDPVSKTYTESNKRSKHQCCSGLHIHIHGQVHLYTRVSTKGQKEASMMVNLCSPSTQEAETGRARA